MTLNPYQTSILYDNENNDDGFAIVWLQNAHENAKV